ncbi:hypothetical protein NKH72_21040, partial [Mesorhizobium sp. M0955]
MDIVDFIVEGAWLVSPLEGEMAAKRPEGVGSAASTSLGLCGASASRAATPSVACGDISPSRGCLDRGHREQVCEDIANSLARF